MESSDTSDRTIRVPKPSQGSPSGRQRQADPGTPGRRDRDSATQGDVTGWRRVLRTAEFWLVTVGVVLVAGGFLLYPFRSDIKNPLPASINIKSSDPISYIGYYVGNISGASDRSSLKIILLGGGSVSKNAEANIEVVLPDGSRFQKCPRPECHEVGTAASIWNSQVRLSSNSFTALVLAVATPSLGHIENGLDATVSLPQLYYHGPGTPILDTTYRMKDAGIYNWSYPVANMDHGGADWKETVLDGTAEDQIVQGLDPSSETRDNIDVFISGALLALGGAALLGAFQVALENTTRRDEARKIKSSEMNNPARPVGRPRGRPAK